MYTSSKSTNAKPMGTISARMFQRGTAINVNMDTSSYSINAKPLGTISYAIDIDRNDFSLVVISTESLYQLSILLYVRLQLGLNSA